MAATRFLASELLSAATKSTDPCPTGCSSIDNVLNGGFDYGLITSIAGSKQADKTLLTLHAIATHLLTTDTDVAYIFTEEADVAIQLHDLLVDRLTLDGSEQKDGDVEDAAADLLGRVKLMRVFDIHGVTQSVSEISEAWSLVEREKRELKASRPDRKEVPSSQDLEDSESEGEESDEPLEITNRGVGLIAIDNIASVFNAEMSKDQIGGQSLLTTFFRSLQHLTREFQICTILANSSVMPSTTPGVGQARPGSVSIFQSTLGRPGLGQLYAHLVDVSILVSEVPKTRVDAEKAYASARGKQSRYSKVKVFEVLGDRSGLRMGRWGAFEVTDGLSLVPYT